MHIVLKSKLFLVVSTVAFFFCGCGDPDTAFLDTNTVGTDPYCNDIDDWESEVTITATYTDPKKKDQIELGLVTKEDVVEIGGQISVSGAEVGLIVYDKPDLYILLFVLDDVQAVTVEGTIQCTNREAQYTVTLPLNPDSTEIDETVVISEETQDGGVSDAGNDD
jgi:hypothetical protein